MQLRTLSYINGAWSGELPTALDSEKTLVLAFGSPTFRSAPAPSSSQVTGAHGQGSTFEFSIPRWTAS